MACAEVERLFSFGIVADVQYADKDDGWNFTKTATRYYRPSLTGLRMAIAAWNDDPLISFAVNLGDIIDGFNHRLNTSEQAMNAVCHELSRFARGRMYNLIGNHEVRCFCTKIFCCP